MARQSGFSGEGEWAGCLLKGVQLLGRRGALVEIQHILGEPAPGGVLVAAIGGQPGRADGSSGAGAITVEGRFLASGTWTI